jgi:hypothetical protein
VKAREITSMTVALLMCGGCPQYHKRSSLGDSGAPDLTLVQGHKILHQAAPPPFGRIVSSKPEYLESPYAPFVLVDVHGLETGTLVIAPLSRKGFVVPEMPSSAPHYGPPLRWQNGHRTGIAQIGPEVIPSRGSRLG